ncbi:hypothetical protein ACFL60_03295 [Candidatus Omnitrophota bacterium]
MRFVCGVIFCSLAVCLLLYSCSDNSTNSPVAPEENSLSSADNIYITGHIHSLSGIEASDVAVRISGSTIDSIVHADKYDDFVIDVRQEGDYVVIPSADGFIFGPTAQHITAHDRFTTVDFMMISSGQNSTVMAGRIVDSENLPVNNVTLQFENVDISDVNKRKYSRKKCSTSAQGYYFLYDELEIGTTYLITLKKSDFDYVVFPDNSYVTIGEVFTVKNFEACNIGKPLYNITGKVVLLDGFDSYVSVYLYHKKYLTASIMKLGRSGEYGFYGLERGGYYLEYITPQLGDIILEKDEAEIWLEEMNIVLPDIMTSNRITDNNVSGRIIEENGTGIDNSQVIVSTSEPTVWFKKVFSDANGDFNLKLAFEFDEERTYSFVPKKDGFSFSPDTLSVHLNWIKGKRVSEIILPDFIGFDYTRTTNAGFFPLATGKSWIYERTENDENPTKHTVSIIGTVNYNNGTYYRFSERSPWKFTDFRIDENDVYTYFDNNEMLFLRFGIAPGTIWECGLEAGVYPRKGIYKGTETVDTPAGEFENCAHFEMKITYSDDMYDSYDLWYASGVGLLKSKKIVVDNGEIFDQVTDELKSYD